MRTLLTLLLLATLLVGAPHAQAQLQPGSALPEATTSFGTVTGATVQLADIQGEQGLVVVLWGADCPWVDRYEERLLALVGDYRSQGFGFALVDPTPAADVDAAARTEQARRYGDVPYLVDPSGRLARALGAARQPEVFVFDGSGTLAYQGALDDSASDPSFVESDYARDALDALGVGGTPPEATAAAFGCSLRL
ncbi:MAG: redoxin domain-containing protein [Bacteroidota bacterium]